MSAVAFVPLRAGGSRVGLIDGLDKERAILGGHPLMAYTIRAAIDSGVFERVIAIVRNDEHARLATKYGAEIPWFRPEYTVQDDSPDIDWVQWALQKLNSGMDEIFAILRVTSPFHTAKTIQRAWSAFNARPISDSLRTVRSVTEHPGKMWVIRDDTLIPLLPMGPDEQPWHSSPTQSLFKTYIQTAGMEFARTNTVYRSENIAGSIIVPFVVDEWEGFDINTRAEWDLAEIAVANGTAKLPEVT